MKKILLSALLLGGITFGSQAQATKKAETKKTEIKIVKPAAPSSDQATISVKKTVVKKEIKANTAVGKKPSTPVASPAAVENANEHSAVAIKKDGTPDKRYKASKKLKKDGTPDKRYKANKP